MFVCKVSLVPSEKKKTHNQRHHDLFRVITLRKSPDGARPTSDHSRAEGPGSHGLSKVVSPKSETKPLAGTS